MASINGFYAGFFTGSGGNGISLFILRDGLLVGADAGPVLFDGRYNANADGSYSGSVKVSIPAGVTVVQGQTAPQGGSSYEVNINLAADFLSRPYFEVQTPLGRVNVRLQKLRELE
ncbi:hypothetical protein [Consotaella aegiceratis]|uniref:hypothetical protein n=1 Tax=Consotaella aegiceratis TaxID=3097961 RepID=UPI002F42F5FE